MPRVVPLESMQPGEQGRIFDVDGRADVVHRLEEMGFRTGTLVRMIQAGSPCIVALHDHRYGLRGEEISSLLVEVS